MKQMLAASMVVLALAACSSNPEPQQPAPTPPPAATVTPPAPPPFNPMGTYDFVAAVQGQELPGTITIFRNDQGALNGRLMTQMTGELVMSTVTVDGKKVTMNGAMPDGTVLSVALTFEDNDKFAGTWSAGGDGGNFSGKRKTTG
jgi:hypothetical protein